MNYTALVFVAAAISLILELTVIRSGLLKMGRFYAAYGIVVFFQFLTNGYLTNTEIVEYDPAAIIGFRIFYAPVEDLLFGFALVLLTMATWTRLGKSECERTAERIQKIERIAENGD
jgi:lycopene cyclase domain-containing protein